ncbi:MAG: ribonuclease H family protein [Hespellia sp.]|nr:ribonuclease H family protein [Hespellia sp.]
MAKKKIYAVRKGKQTGLFYDWKSCQEAVSGYSGAEFQGFQTEEEARAYLTEVPKEIPKDHLIVYIDGSYDQNIGRYSFGCVILTPTGEIIRESGNGSEPESLAIRNVAGEMLGAMFAVQWARVNGYPAVELRYDYAGIEKWATGAWKAKNNLTQKYTAYMVANQQKIQIKFTKVKAHSGDFYNEEVDQLAKVALTEGNGIPKIKRLELN